VASRAGLSVSTTTAHMAPTKAALAADPILVGPNSGPRSVRVNSISPGKGYTNAAERDVRGIGKTTVKGRLGCERQEVPTYRLLCVPPERPSSPVPMWPSTAGSAMNTTVAAQSTVTQSTKKDKGISQIKER